MRKKQLLKSIVLAFSFFFFQGTTNAQDTKKLDQAIKNASTEMYVNPDKVIRVGIDVVNKAGGNINIKIRGYKLIADGYSSKRDYQKSLEYVIKASDLLSQSDDKLLKILIVNKVGIQYHQLKIYDKSIQYLDEAEKLCLEYPVRDSVRISLGANYIVRGFIYKEKLNCDIAIAFFDKGINELNQSTDLLNIASKLSIAKYNKGNCYILLSENEAAIRSFEESIFYAKQINANSLHAFAKKGIAQVYTIQGKYNEAIQSLDEAKQLSSNVSDLVLNQEIYKGLSENYLAMNNMEKYKESQQEYLSIQLKLKESERKSISNLLDEKEKETRSKIESDGSKFIISLIILCTIIIIVIVFFYVKKSRTEIEELNREIGTLQIDN